MEESNKSYRISALQSSRITLNKIAFTELNTQVEISAGIFQIVHDFAGGLTEMHIL